MGKCLFMRKGETHTAPVNFNPVFANNTWEQIIEACQKNKVPDTWVVGSQKTMTINGKDYLIDIIGKNHDTYSDGSGKAPLTFQMHDLYETTYAMNNTNTNGTGWTSCAMRSTHLPAIKAFMPVDVQNAIRKVNKLAGMGGANNLNINANEDELFLLAEIEVFGKANYSAPGEGTQYDYYKAGNSASKKGSTANTWWLRSPNTGDKYYFCHIKTDGSYDANAANVGRGVSFAFCF